MTVRYNKLLRFLSGKNIMQNYLGRYQDLSVEWKRRREENESTDISDDIVFEIELIRQIEINIDYILMLVKKYHDSHCSDKEVLIDIRKLSTPVPNCAARELLSKLLLPASMMWMM